MNSEGIERIIRQFDVYGDLLSVAPFGTGHINNTYVSTFMQAGTAVRYTHQRINRKVFLRPEEVMGNIAAVTGHIGRKLAAAHIRDASSRVLTVVPGRDGNPFCRDEHGDYWRTYLFIENVRSYQMLDNPSLAYRVGEAVGTFQYQLSDYAGPRLFDTIPLFHNMESRYAQFDAARSADTSVRVRRIGEEIEFLLENRKRGMILDEGLREGTLKEGITHNDTKLNNILFDSTTGEAVCVIDLDTVMPGTILFDTGVLIRTATNTGEEDETDLSRVGFDITLFESLIGGYLSKAGSFLTPYEKELLAESGRNITQIMAVRFLTDYLNGDVYYKTSRESHNLDRCRTQIALIRSMDAQWEHIHRVLARLTQ